MRERSAKWEAVKDQYDKLVQTVWNTELFARPVKVSVVIDSVTTEDDGSIIVLGTFRGRDEKTGAYFTQAERDDLAEFDNGTRNLEERHQRALRHRGLTRNAHASTRLRWADDNRQYNRKMQGRRENRARVISDLTKVAAPREDEFELEHS